MRIVGIQAHVRMEGRLPWLDGSLASIEHVRDARIRRFRQPNGGLSAARNAGRRLARRIQVATAG
ncbi:MAG: glycosyltransferase family 2 protein [Gammaproteobacteria bacterium]|nr:glycosyltransferase family 2 protein [Gammaproteobacteria bacterium]